MEFIGIFWKDFRRILEGFFLGGLFWGEFFGRYYMLYFNVEGIDLFVKILGFVKILSESRRKEDKIRSFEVRLQVLTSHLKIEDW